MGCTCLCTFHTDGTDIYRKSSSPVPKLIIDTDMDFDVDDVGAICAAHAMADRGEVEIIAIVHNVGYPTAIGAVSVLNYFYGRDQIALGAFKGHFGAEKSGPYIDDLVENFDSPIKHYDQVTDAVQVLREALAAAEDQSVVISSVGFLTNIAELLSSPGDSVSPKTGYDLVRDKVQFSLSYSTMAVVGSTTFDFDFR